MSIGYIGNRRHTRLTAPTGWPHFCRGYSIWLSVGSGDLITPSKGSNATWKKNESVAFLPANSGGSWTRSTHIPTHCPADAMRLLLFTGARKSVVLGARWDQFDLDAGVWIKPSSHTKQKK